MGHPPDLRERFVVANRLEKLAVELHLDDPDVEYMVKAVDIIRCQDHRISELEKQVKALTPNTEIERARKSYDEESRAMLVQLGRFIDFDFSMRDTILARYGGSGVSYAEKFIANTDQWLERAATQPAFAHPCVHGGKECDCKGNTQYCAAFG